MGKKKVISEEEIKDMVLPVANDVLGIVVKLLGFDRVLVKCQDGHERLCRIRGKMKRRVWIREGDVVLVSPWDFQSYRFVERLDNSLLIFSIQTVFKH